MVNYYFKGWRLTEYKYLKVSEHPISAELVKVIEGEIQQDGPPKYFKNLPESRKSPKQVI